MIQLFDLSVIPKNHSDDEHDKSHSSLPSLMHKGRKESLFSLGTLLYRVAHRLSLSKVLEIESCAVSHLCDILKFRFVNILVENLYFVTIWLLQASDNSAKCAKFFKNCLDFLREQDHLVSFLSVIIPNFIIHSLVFRTCPSNICS